MSLASQQSDVLIIGGGVIGLTSALRLARAGLCITVLDRARAGRESSWAAAGVLSPCSWSRRDALSELLRDSLAQYPAFVAGIEDLAGMRVEYIRSGRLECLDTDQHERMARAEVRDMAPYVDRFGLPLFEVLTAAEARTREPALAADARVVTHCQLTAQIRNPRLLQALLIACRRAGVDLREGEPVTALRREGDRIVGAQSASTRYSAAHTVLAAGAWSALVDADLARLAPTYPVRGQIVLLHLPAGGPRHIIEKGKCYIVPRADGHVLVGATEEHDSGYSTENTAEGVAGLLAQALTLVPALRDAALVRTWAGLRPGTPDRRPILGVHEDAPGLIFATGHFRTGIALAPVTAEIVSDLVTRGGSPRHLDLCRPGRDFGTRNAM